MRLLYLTNVQIPAKNAQNLQIQSMSKAFNLSLGRDFLLISPQCEQNRLLNKDFEWIKLKVPKFLPRFLRQAVFVLEALPTVIRFKADAIFTRDVVVACIYHILGFQTLYEIHKPFETRIGNFLFRVISKKIKIVAISQALKDFVVKKYDLNANKILVAHDGVFLEDFNKITESKEVLKKKYLNLDKDKFVALYSGSLQKGKGFELILEAAKKIPDAYFVIIGSGELNYNDKYPNLIFLGHHEQNEIPYYLKSADLLLLPLTNALSYCQFSSPLKLFEYMASGVPILASDMDSIREILNDGNSFLFDSTNEKEFIAQVSYIMENMNIAQLKVDVIRKIILDYDWTKRVKKVLGFMGFNKE